MRSPTRPSDYIILTTDGSIGNADGAARTSRETQARLTLTAISFVALIVVIAAPRGVVKQVAYIVFAVTALAAFVLVIRYMRHLYRSPTA